MHFYFHVSEHIFISILSCVYNICTLTVRIYIPIYTPDSLTFPKPPYYTSPLDKFKLHALHSAHCFAFLVEFCAVHGCIMTRNVYYNIVVELLTSMKLAHRLWENRSKCIPKFIPKIHYQNLL